MLVLQVFGLTADAAGTYQVKESSQGWVYNGTDVEITKHYISGQIVTLLPGQSDMWNPSGKIFPGFALVVPAFTTGKVTVQWCN